jgi:hypothetical protein
MPSIVVVVVPLVLGFWIGGQTNVFVGVAVWFGSSWILGMIQRASRARRAQQLAVGLTDARSSAASGRGIDVIGLQELYANRVSFGVVLPTEAQEIDRVYGMLRDAGADADQWLVDNAKAENAEWIETNPHRLFHEPHLNRSEFDRERPDRAI